MPPAHRCTQLRKPRSFKDRCPREDIAVDAYYLPALLGRIRPARRLLGGEGGVVLLPSAADPAVDGDALRSIHWERSCETSSGASGAYLTGCATPPRHPLGGDFFLNCLPELVDLQWLSPQGGSQLAHRFQVWLDPPQLQIDDGTLRRPGVWPPPPLVRDVLAGDTGTNRCSSSSLAPCTFLFTGALRRRYALSIGALLLAFVLLIPTGVGAEAPPDMVVYDYTTTNSSYWTPIIIATVDEFNAVRPDTAPRLVYSASPSPFCGLCSPGSSPSGSLACRQCGVPPPVPRPLGQGIAISPLACRPR